MRSDNGDTPSRSAQLFARAKRVLPGGVSRNTVLRKPHPQYAARGEGCRVWDVDGNCRIDFANNMASLIHGHAHPYITEVVTRQLLRGTAFTLGTEQEIEYAAFLVGRVPAFDKIRFVNSGTEATMSAVRLARGHTGRSRVIKFEGWDFLAPVLDASGRCRGCVAQNMTSMQIHAIPADAVIVADIEIDLM